jgi:hypothetical protein
VGFVDDEEADGRTGGQADRTGTQLLVCYEQRPSVMLREQRTPLWGEDGRHDERERLGASEGKRQRDVRLAEPNGVREQCAAVSLQDLVEPTRRGDLVRGEPGRQRKRAVARCEQGARGEPRDGGRRRFAAGPKQKEQRVDCRVNL